MQLAIPTTQPFSFAQTLAFLRRFPPCQRQYVIDDTSLTAALTVEGRAIAFTLREGLTLELPDDLSQAARAQAVTSVSAFVGAHDDVSTFYAHAAADGPMRQLVDLLHGLHHVRFLSLAEIAVYSVLMQRAPIAVAAALHQRFLHAFGTPVAHGERTLYAMPELAALRELSVAHIAKAIGHRAKAERVADVVRGVDELGEPLLRDAPYEQARDALLAIRGVGPFSAAAILLRGLGRMDDLPWLPQFASVARTLYRRPVSHASIAKRYGRLIGYWSFYVMTGVPRLAA